MKKIIFIILSLFFFTNSYAGCDVPLTDGVAQVSEGQSIAITINNLDSNTSYPYNLSYYNSSSNSSDFNNPSGNVNSNSSGVATANIQVTLDEIVESTEKFKFTIQNTENPSSSSVSTDWIDVINVKTFLLSASFSGNEGDQVTLTLTGANGLSNVPVYVRRKDERGNLHQEAGDYTYDKRAYPTSAMDLEHVSYKNYPYQIGTISDDGQLQWTSDKVYYQPDGSTNGSTSTFVCGSGFAAGRQQGYLEFYLQGHPSDGQQIPSNHRGQDSVEVSITYEYKKMLHIEGAGAGTYIDLDGLPTFTSSGITYYYAGSTSYTSYPRVRLAILNPFAKQSWSDDRNSGVIYDADYEGDINNYTVFSDCQKVVPSYYELYVQKHLSLTGSAQSLNASDFLNSSGYSYATQVNSNTVSLGNVTSSTFYRRMSSYGGVNRHYEADIYYSHNNSSAYYLKFYLVPKGTLTQKQNLSSEVIWVKWN